MMAKDDKTQAAVLDDVDLAEQWLKAAEAHLSDVPMATDNDAALAVEIAKARMQLWSLKKQRDYHNWSEDQARKQAEDMAKRVPPVPFPVPFPHHAF